MKTNPCPNQVYPVNNLEGLISLNLVMVGSKSISHRALIIAALAEGTSELENLSTCHDVNLTMNTLKKIGIRIEYNESSTIVWGGGIKAIRNFPETINLEDSGTSYRFFLSFFSLFDHAINLYGTARMNKRPIRDLVDILTQGKVKVIYLNKQGYPPVQVQGPFEGGTLEISSQNSSQFASSLLLISPYVRQGLNLSIIGKHHSIPYIHMTIMIMKSFGIEIHETSDSDSLTFQINANQKYSPQKYSIEGDFSGAAFFLVAGAIMGGQIQISNIPSVSIQGDKYILHCLQEAGCEIESSNGILTLTKENKDPIHALHLDLGNFPDLVLPLAILAVFAEAPSMFYNIGHLQHKESNRIQALASNLTRVGIKTHTTEDSITIIPNTNLHGAVIDSFNDHRIVMSFAILGLKVPGVVLKNPKCVEKSYPHFFTHLEQIKPYQNISGEDRVT